MIFRAHNEPIIGIFLVTIHQLLTKGLSVDRGIRHRRVGVTGTSYHPLDNEFQIREAMLVFYEQNNLYVFKQIFIDQFEFAVREYF